MPFPLAWAFLLFTLPAWLLQFQCHFLQKGLCGTCNLDPLSSDCLLEFIAGSGPKPFLSVSMPSASDSEVPLMAEEEVSSLYIGRFGYVTCFGYQNELRGTLSMSSESLHV